MKYKHILPLLLLLITSSCTKEIPYPDNDKDPSLVINALFTAEQDFLVEVSQTGKTNQLSNPYYFFDATVKLFDENQSLLGTTSVNDQGLYAFENIQPQWGKSYTIEASAADFKTVSAVNRLPKSFSAALKDFGISNYNSATSSNSSSSALQVTIEIEDNPDEENYYIIEMDLQLNVEQFTFSGSNYYGYFSDDPNLEFSEGTSFNGQNAPPKLFFTDANINGTTHTLNFGLSDPRFLEALNSNGSYVDCKIRSVTKDYYLYAKSLEQALLSKGDDFAEPVTVYNNIENGYGLFAGYTEQTLKILF